MKNISMIAAIGKNNELGKNNDLIWRISADLKRFKQLTTGHVIVMGRKTFESLKNGALPNRRNIVLSSDTNYKATGAEVSHSIDRLLGTISETEDVYIVGGSTIYALFFPFASTLHITKIEAKSDADAFFPEIDTKIWQEVDCSEIMEDEKSGLKYTYVTYSRRK